MGSSLPARRAGTKPATAAATSMTANAPANVGRSNALSPKSSALDNRATATTAGIPSSTPAEASIKASRRTSQIILPEVAPSAMYADLAGAPRHRIREGTVEPNAGERQCQRPECGSQCRDQALAAQ